MTDDPTLRRLADANPVPDGPLNRAEAARAEAALDRILVDPPPGASRAASRRRWWTWIAATMAAVATAAAAGALATAPASAEHVLLEAASNAAAQPVAAGQYWYVRTEVDELAMDPYQREVWRSRDDFLLRTEQDAALAAADAGHESLDPDLVRVMDLSDSVEGGGPHGFGEAPTFTWDELAALPTDPAALSERLTDGLPATSHGDDWDLWNQTESLLRESPARPALRRALWEVLATVRGVELVGRTTDSTGRDATAIRADFSDRGLGGFELLLDPGDGTLLESRVTDDDDMVTFRTTLLDQGPRTHAPVPDPPVCGPGSVPEKSC